VTKVIREEFKKFLNPMKMNIQHIPESVEHSKDYPKGEVYSYKCLHYKNRDLSTKQPDDVPLAPRKPRTN
jgi:hypothetical protein